MKRTDGGDMSADGGVRTCASYVVQGLENFRSGSAISEGDDTNMCGQDATGCEVVVTLTKLGVGEEDDKSLQQ